MWLPLALLTVLAALLAVADGPVWGGLFIFTTAAAAGRLPLRKALLAIAAIALMIVVGGWREHMSSAEIAQALITAGVTAAATLTVVQSVRTNRKLRAEREEMARFAGVAAERLRIARDLHDLLGHSLSLIALKSELAGRLVEVAPEQAAAEIGDIEQVARTALQEVREAVAGYRQPTLADELRDAREILAAAGISYHYEGDTQGSGRFPSAIEATLAWALREGITNVIRHSHAQSCRVRVFADGATARLEIRDDGAAVPLAPPAAETLSDGPGGLGSGLRGLAERVAALGGRCEAGPDSPGGFRLAISLPLGGRQPGVGLPGASASSALPPASTAATIATEGASGARLNGEDQHRR